MSLLAKSARRAFKTARQLHGTACIYRRGAATVSLTLIRGRSEMVSALDDVEDNWTGLDWLGLAEELVISDEITRPERGDVIEAGTEQFEVLPYDDECYSIDPTQTVLRIHSKRIV
ncbi:MAG: hypothetical protein KF777_01470 [Planctomycetaceae bacterium]|nr:hypothetical protein [Planctomycetaceae bacterium]